MSTRLPGPERKKQLLEVARKVLATKGYYETTMTDIATAAGVTKPVLYQHYQSKRDLYRNVLEDVGDRLQQAVVAAASSTESPRQRVEKGIAAYVDFVATDEAGFRLLFSGANRHDPEWASLTAAVEDSLARTIAKFIDVPGLETSRRQALAHGVIGLAETMTRFALSDEGRPYPREKLATDVSTLIWAGLRGAQAGQP